MKGHCCAILMMKKSSVLLPFFLGTLIGPVYTCLVLVVFQIFWQRCQLPCVVHPAASSFGCPGFLPLKTRVFRSPTCNIPHCLFTQQLVVAPSGHILVAPNESVRSCHPSKWTYFQPNFPKTLGYKDQQHIHQFQPTCILQNADFRKQLSRSWRARNFTPNLS